GCFCFEIVGRAGEGRVCVAIGKMEASGRYPCLTVRARRAFAKKRYRHSIRTTLLVVLSSTRIFRISEFENVSTLSFPRAINPNPIEKLESGCTDEMIPELGSKEVGRNVTRDSDGSNCRTRKFEEGSVGTYWMPKVDLRKRILSCKGRTICGCGCAEMSISNDVSGSV